MSDMKKYLFAIAAVMMALTAGAQVKPGIEVLREGGFAQLKGKRVGLRTNPTGVDNNLKSTVDILHEAEGVELVALYGPEHGVRGDVHAGDKVDNSIDPATGVKVYSLYGKSHKPTAKMLKDIDVLIYDIQDNGCRSYTFISSMGVCMEACAENGKEFMVLDRPNPLGGNKVEGCLVEDGFYSFVSKYKIPYLYGLTPGELALYLNNEGLLKDGEKCKLTVIPMQGWHRYMTFEQTGMPWILPSPHVPQAAHSAYYAATGIIGETPYVNIGVGYTLPFQLFCQEWIDAQKFTKAMNDLHLKGVIFRPIYVKPFYGANQGTNIQGVQVYITDVVDCDLTLIQFYAIEVLAKMYPEHLAFDKQFEKRFNMFDKVCGTDKIRKMMSENYKVADIIDYWNKDADSFRLQSSKYYLYR